MPKLSKDLHRRIDFWATMDQFRQVTALMYLRGDKKISVTARFLLGLGVKTYISGLTGAEQRELAFIRNRLETAEKMDVGL